MPIENLSQVSNIGQLISYFQTKNRSNDSYLTKDEIPEEEIKCCDRNQDGKLTLLEVLSSYKTRINIEEISSEIWGINFKIKGENEVIQGLKIKDESTVWLYENGNLKLAISAEDQDVQGMDAKDGAVLYRENGKLWFFYLAKNRVIDGEECKAGSWVGFDKNGKLESVAENQ